MSNNSFVLKQKNTRSSQKKPTLCIFIHFTHTCMSTNIVPRTIAPRLPFLPICIHIFIRWRKKNMKLKEVWWKILNWTYEKIFLCGCVCVCVEEGIMSSSNIHIFLPACCCSPRLCLPVESHSYSLDVYGWIISYK